MILADFVDDCRPTLKAKLNKQCEISVGNANEIIFHNTQ